MKIKINPFTFKVNDDITKVVSEQTYWKYFFKLINIELNILTDKEIEFISAYIINSDIDYICEEIGLTKNNYYGMLKKLKEKKIIVDNTIHPKFKAVIEYVRKYKKYDFEFNIGLTIGDDT